VTETKNGGDQNERKARKSNVHLLRATRGGSVNKRESVLKWRRIAWVVDGRKKQTTTVA